MAGCIQFTIEGLSTRGFYVHMYNWVPYRGERLDCKIGENGAISAFKDEQIVGNVPKEWSKKYREWLKAGGKLEAIVHYGLHRVHMTKGEEVPVIYLFTGDHIPLLINTKTAIKEATNQKAKRKKSLKFHDGDQTDTLLQRNVGSLKPRKRDREETSHKSAKKLRTRSPVHGKIPLKEIDNGIQLSEKDFSKLSQLIGKNWKHLGRQLGLTDVQISHVDINARCHSTQDKIHEMFVKWAKKNPEENTLATVISAVNESFKTEIEKTEFGKFIDEKRSAKKRRQ